MGIFGFFLAGQPGILPETRGFTGETQDKYGIWPATAETFPTAETTFWLSPKLLEAYYDLCGATNLGTKTTSLVVLHRGRILYEYYTEPALVTAKNGDMGLLLNFNGVEKDILRPLRSGSKSFVSAVVGIAIGEGYIGSVSDRVIDYFPGAAIPAGQESKRDMTIEHLLNMTSGLPGDFDPISFIDEDAFEQLHETDVPLMLFTQIPQKYNPGQAYNYSTLAVDILAGAVSRAVGMPFLEYADEKLFKPLGITEYFWDTYSDGSAKAGAELSLSTHGMLRFGYLYLNNGRWGDQQVIPAGWVAQTPPQGISPRAYNRLFWQTPFLPGYGAGGAYGQCIDIIPALDLVIVRTGMPGPFDEAVMKVGGWLGVL